jgi:hypothetical protein
MHARRIALALLAAGCARGPVTRLPARREAARPVPADTEVVTERLAWDPERGALALTRRGGHHRVLVNGRPVWEDDVANASIYALVQPRDGSAAVVLAITPGGTGCEQLYRVLELQYRQPPRMTPEFGTCAAAPEVRYVHERLTMHFEGWLPPPLALRDTLPPGTPEPLSLLVEYRDGRIDTVAVGSRADRLARQ